MKYIIILSLSVMSFFSCNTTNNTLKKYYNHNVALHNELADSLMVFAKKYHTNEVIMRKRLDINGQIIFRYFIQTHEPARIGIQFDSDLKRTDLNPEITLKIIIPIEIIKLFKKSMYTELIADSNKVFFGYKDSFDGNSVYGILIDRDPTDNSSRYILKLAKNVYITKEVIP